jgi:hypothetical protein
MAYRTMYKNPRFLDKAHQTVVFNSPIRAYTRVVRDVQEWDGRTVGWIRHRHGEWVVQQRGEFWEVLEGVSTRELQR